MERAFHLPQLPGLRDRPTRFGGAMLAVVEPSAADMDAVVAALRGLASRSPDRSRRAQTLARAARRFLDRQDPLRRRALASLPAITGFSPATIEESLGLVFAPLADATAIAAAVRGAERTAQRIAEVVGVVSAGNVPGVALFKTTLALAAGASCIVKTAAGEPLLTVLFAEAIHAIDPSLASSLAVLWWEGGAAACEERFLRGVDSLVAYGSDESIASLAARAQRGFFGHGRKLSVATVRLARGADLERLADDAARDVALYDQQGCLSPQSIYVIGGEEGRRGEFVERLASSLDALERRWPPGPIPEAHALLIRRLRDEYEWRALAGERASVHTKGGGSWTILEDPAPELGPSPLHRTVFVRALGSPDALGSALGEWLPRVESVGVGPWPDPEMAAAGSALAIPRVVPLGSMQSPDLTWRQGGREPTAGISLAETL